MQVHDMSCRQEPTGAGPLDRAIGVDSYMLPFSLLQSPLGPSSRHLIARNSQGRDDRCTGIVKLMLQSTRTNTADYATPGPIRLKMFMQNGNKTPWAA